MNNFTFDYPQHYGMEGAEERMLDSMSEQLSTNLQDTTAKTTVGDHFKQIMAKFENGQEFDCEISFDENAQRWKAEAYHTNARFEKWVDERTKEIFQTEKFKAIGKEDDFVFQALAFAGDASAKLSYATTVLHPLAEVPTELKEGLKTLQQQLHDWKVQLRESGRAN